MRARTPNKEGNPIQEYLDCKRRAEQARKEVEKAEWQLEQLMGELKTRFSCSSLEAGDAKLVQLEEARAEAARRLEEATQSFTTEFEEALG